MSDSPRAAKWVAVATVASAIIAITQLTLDHGPYKPVWRKSSRQEPPKTQQQATKPSGTTVEVKAAPPVDPKLPQEEATAPVAAGTPQSASENLRAGHALATRRDFAGAHAEFQRAAMIEPHNAFAWANLGAAAAMLDRQDEARRAYEQALKLDNDNWLAHYNLACLLSRARERQKALDHLALAVHQLAKSTPDKNILRATLNKVRSDDAFANVRTDPNFDAIFDIE